MANELPDELVLHIFSHILHFSDQVFMNTPDDANSLNIIVQQSTSLATCIGVCKRWRQIATPLLYHTIILRSSIQAEHLALSLRDNKRLGRSIKKLRIEGGFGGAMYNIVKAAPNVKDLCLTLYIESLENVSGLCRALPMMKPTRVILYDRVHLGLESSHVRTLHNTICQCFRTWKTMRTLYFPYSEGLNQAIASSVHQLAEAIRDAPALQEIHIPFAYSFPQHLSIIGRNTSLRAVFIQRLPRYANTPFNFERAILSDPKLKDLVVFQDTTSSVNWRYPWHL